MPTLGYKPTSANITVSCKFGVKGSTDRWKLGYHAGIDFACNLASPVLAFASGKVIICHRNKDGWGLRIGVLHADGFKSFYCHLKESFVKVGDAVCGGAYIADSGNTGNSTGPHLHFELRNKDNKPIEPKFYDN